MIVWGVLVNYKDGTFNINEAYQTFSKARNAIMYKIGDHEYDDTYRYTIEDKDANIEYQIKSISVV